MPGFVLLAVVMHGIGGRPILYTQLALGGGAHISIIRLVTDFDVQRRRGLFGAAQINLVRANVQNASAIARFVRPGAVPNGGQTRCTLIACARAAQIGRAHV